MSMISATILTGFLGAGKTTLLKRVLSQNHGLKLAIIENEFGSENIDHDILVTGSKEQIIQMNNGCICCTIREDLRAALQLLATQKRQGLLDFDRVVIETTGVADPGPVVQTFFMDDEVATCYLLDSILTLVDAKHAQAQLDQHQEARRQVGFADQIFISKTDLVAASDTTALMDRLRQMNPRARLQAVHFGDVLLSDIFDLHGFHLDDRLGIDPDFLQSNDGHDHHPRCHEHGTDCGCQSHRLDHHHGRPHALHDDVSSFVFRSDKALDPKRLEDFLGAMVEVYGPRMLRYKGVLSMQGTDRKVIFQGVHQLMGSDLGQVWADGEKRESKMVFIGIDLPVDIFLQGMEQSLV